LLPASGWRLETEEKTDKKKSDFYFFTSHKKFLTEKIIGPLARVSLGDDGSGTTLTRKISHSILLSPLRLCATVTVRK